jgi:ectoine hydroxylase-related dioxygenase (phytanoyl-CoA dioxygenase family)
MTNIALENGNDIEEALNRFTSDGFLIMHNLCDENLVNHVRHTSLTRAQAIKDTLGSKEIGIGSAAGYDEIVQRSPGRWDVPISLEDFGLTDKEMPWWPCIAAILGADAEHSFSGLVSSEPNTPAQHWHTDSPHEASEHRPAHAINILMALHDIPMEMGPTEFAKGSQTMTNHLSNSSLVLNELIYQHATTTPETLVENTTKSVPESCSSALVAGTCIIFDDRMLHRGLANQSDKVRHVAYFSYRVKGYSANTHFEAQRSIYDKAI